MYTVALSGATFHCENHTNAVVLGPPAYASGRVRVENLQIFRRRGEKRFCGNDPRLFVASQMQNRARREGEHVLFGGRLSLLPTHDFHFALAERFTATLIHLTSRNWCTPALSTARPTSHLFLFFAYTYYYF
jgi:hypothetical protein